VSSGEAADRRRLVQQVSQAGAVAGRDFSQSAKYAAGRDQVVREIHIHLEGHGEGELPAPPAWVADPSLESSLVFGVPLFPSEYFTGRGTSLTALAEALATLRPPQFLVIAGPAGVGKTQLAVEYAYGQRQNYDVIWWVRADQSATLISDFIGLAAHGPLALEAGVRADQSADEQVDAVRSWFERHDRWLLLFDNAHDLSDLRALLPRGGDGRVVTTTRRDTGWEAIARVLSLDVLSPESASAFLRQRSGDDDVGVANQLVAELGYLPLALEQAGAFISQTAGFGLADYLQRFRKQSKDLLDRGQAFGYEGTINTTWNLSFEHLQEKAPDAIELLTLFAFLDPDDIPSTLLFKALLAQAKEDDDGPLDALELADAVTALRSYGLVKAAGDGLFVHRLLQAVVRNGLEPDDQRDSASAALWMIVAAFDADEDETAQSGRHRLIPHGLAAVAHAERLGIDAWGVSVGLDRVAAYLYGRGQYSQAVPLFRRALAIDQELPADTSTIIADRQALGLALRAQGELAGARAEFERAIELGERVLGADHPDLVVPHSNLGLALQGQGELAGARAEFERAIELGERVLGANDVNLGYILHDRGALMRQLGAHQQERADFAHALAIKEAALGETHIQVAYTLVELGRAERELDDLTTAREHLERGLAIEEAALGENHIQVAYTLFELGRVERELGDLTAAREHLNRDLAIEQAALGRDDISLAYTLHALGAVLCDLDECEHARAYLQRARKMVTAAQGEDSSALSPILTDLGRVSARLDEPDRAKAYLEWALAAARATSTDDPQASPVLSELQPVLDALSTRGDRERVSARIAEPVDEIIPCQREWVFDLRRRALQGDDVRPDLERCLAENFRAAVSAFTRGPAAETWDRSGLTKQLDQQYGLQVELPTAADSIHDPEVIAEQIRADAISAWNARKAELGDELIPALERFLIMQVIDNVWPLHRDRSAERVALRVAKGDDHATDLRRALERELHERLCGDFFRLLLSVEVTPVSSDVAS
jgi:tetratricopeptide (TPR) repeat protein